MAIKQFVSSFARLVLPLCVLVFLLGVPSHRAEAQCATLTACVDSADVKDFSIQTRDIALNAIKTVTIAVGAVTEAQMGPASVRTIAIAPGAITDAKMAPGSVRTIAIAPEAVGEAQLQDDSVGLRQLRPRAVGQEEVQLNSLTEQHFSVANRRVVAKAGGDFTSISAALAKLSPSASIAYVIDVMPGTYVENVTMKSFVHLRGAGRDLVHIVHEPACGFCNVIQMIDTERVEISGVTIRGAPEGASGIYIEGGHGQVIRGNTITLNGLGGSGNGGFGIYVRRVSAGGGSVKIIDNEIHQNGCTGIGTEESRPYIFRNLIRLQEQNCVQEGSQDVSILSGGAVISFNVLQTIAGLGGQGLYNASLDGIPVAVP